MPQNNSYMPYIHKSWLTPGGFIELNKDGVPLPMYFAPKPQAEKPKDEVELDDILQKHGFPEGLAGPIIYKIKQDLLKWKHNDSNR